MPLCDWSAILHKTADLMIFTDKKTDIPIIKGKRLTKPFPVSMRSERSDTFEIGFTFLILYQKNRMGWRCGFINLGFTDFFLGHSNSFDCC